MTKLQVVLTVNQRSKEIPYPPATNPGSQNFGFRVLKGKLDKIANIQEAKDSVCLQKILTILNSKESPFFSVGCEKAFNSSPGEAGHWAKGYIEFAYNYREYVEDARAYFPLFFHFTKSAADYVNQRPVQFLWDLQPARFKAVECAGFSCCVWITTGQFASSEQARAEWENAVDVLARVLKHVAAEPSSKVTRIY